MTTKENLNFLSQRGVIVTGVIIGAILIGLGILYEPVTRHYIATDGVCSYCHVEKEYLHTARMPFTKPHPAELKDDQTPARCVDCHLPKGFINTTFAYTHFVSVTDLFGHFRDREGERSGDWIPLSAARAYRVRDRLNEYDSETCRTCHVMEEIIPESVRGQTAHKDAITNQETCVECHSNLVHRFVEVRLVEATSDEEEEGGDDFGEEEFDDEFDEFDEPEGDGGEMEEEVL